MKKTENNDLNEVTLVYQKIHSNWMSGKPLNEGVESYTKNHPEDFKRVVSICEKMNEAFNNPPIKQSGCCGGSCGCHE